MIQHHVHIRSTDQFNQVGVHEKNIEMRSIVWITIAFCCAFEVFGLRADWFVLTEFEVFLAIFLFLLGGTSLSQVLFLTGHIHL